MKKIQLLSVILLALFIFGFSSNKEEDKIRQCFMSFKEGVTKKNADIVLSVIDVKSINYFNNICQLVRIADSITIEKQSLSDKMMILFIRIIAEKEEIMKIDGKGLIRYVINKGMLGQINMSKNDVADITIKKSSAKGVLVNAGVKTQFFYYFNREKENWRIDLTGLLPPTTQLIKKSIQNSSMTENEYILNLLEIMTGKKPGQEIWKPVVKG
jgi:hypothetical protein